MKNIIKLLRVLVLILGTLAVIFAVAGIVYAWQGPLSLTLSNLAGSLAVLAAVALLALIQLTKPHNQK